MVVGSTKTHKFRCVSRYVIMQLSKNANSLWVIYKTLTDREVRKCGVIFELNEYTTASYMWLHDIQLYSLNQITTCLSDIQFRQNQASPCLRNLQHYTMRMTINHHVSGSDRREESYNVIRTEYRKLLITPRGAFIDYMDMYLFPRRKVIK